MQPARIFPRLIQLGTRKVSLGTSSYEEIRIPVPWGHIAGKWWGPKDIRPVLSLHGWQDNCGSFDLLIPTLQKKDLPFLAIDLPGHGLSSKMPSGIFYHGMDGVILIRRLKEYFKWDKISLMGHSLGSITSYTYGFLYPSSVDFMICIDGLHPLINPKGIDRCVQSINEFIKYDTLNNSKVEPPSYTLEEMAEKLNKGTRGSIEVEKAKYILERNVKPSKTNPGKYYFDRDARLKAGPLINWSYEALLEGASRVNFPIFMSKAKGSPFFSNKEHFMNVYEVLKKSSPYAMLHEVPGTHHGHLNQPEIFKDLIPEFIKTYNTHDRTQVPIFDHIKAKI